MKISHREIVIALYKKHKNNFSKNDINKAIMTFVNILKSEINKGNNVTIKGFGSFKITKAGLRRLAKIEEKRITRIKEVQRNKMARLNAKIEYWRELAEYNQWMIVQGHDTADRLPANVEGRKSTILHIKHSAIHE
jgi:nucleoid DNA-binding protein